MINIKGEGFIRATTRWKKKRARVTNINNYMVEKEERESDQHGKLQGKR